MIEASELIINDDGSVFHLHLRPGELAETVILVGDPGRVDTIAKYFDSVECRRQNREFNSITGYLAGKRLSAVSTGIGCDNIDIVVNELDALVNVDFGSRTVKKEKTSLRLLRLGTSGALQRDIAIGDYVMSKWSLGMDGLLNFYDGAQKVSNQDLEREFVAQTHWGERLARPYFVENDKELVELFSDFAIAGLTASASGFYGPQGRVVRLPLADASFLDRIERFNYQGLRVTNFEMESSAIASLSKLMGHKALTICAIIAQRTAGVGQPNYSQIVNNLIEKALERLTK